MRSHSDVVIIGGGVIGTSIAYLLASEGRTCSIRPAKPEI